jgi:hypothetical protein
MSGKEQMKIGIILPYFGPDATKVLKLCWC